jgi:hypothetical protein
MLVRHLIVLLGVASGFFGCRGCESAPIGEEDVDIQLSPEALSFNSTEVGQRRELELSVGNLGRVSARIELRVSDGSPFDVEAAVELEAGARKVIPVAFAPTSAGTFQASLTVRVEDSSILVPLSGTALSCVSSGACRTSTFDEKAGICVEEVWADGTFCKTLCLIGGRCEEGVCQGFEIDCDDQNPCTTDSCEEAVGCVNREGTAHCPGPEEPCQVPVCDPASGCGLAIAPDGTACESTCVVGQCLLLRLTLDR